MVKIPEKKKYASTREALLDRIEVFLGKNPHCSETLFGWYAVQDSSLVARLRDGKDVTTAKLDAILKFIANPIH